LEKRQVFDRTGAHSIADAFEKYQVQSVSEYLHTLARLTRSANGVFGLKMDLGQASILIRRGLFYNSAWRWKYIFVTRRDYLLQAISYATALQTDSWSSLSVTGKSAQFDQEAIFNAMMRLSDLTRRWECIFSLLAVDPLRIAYEDIEADPTRVVQQCLRTLGVPFDVSKLKSTSIYRRQRTSQADDWAEAIRRHARELGNPKTEPDQFANAGE
jgi:LPS sulfotransferase NodH